MQYDIKLLPIQKKLYQSTKPIAGIYSSRATGKTYILSWLIFLAIMQGQKSLAFSQTHKSLTQNLFADVMQRFSDVGIVPTYNRTALTISFNDGIVFGYSYDSMESVRGQSEIENLFLDELALAGQDLFATVNPCLRGNGIKPKIRFCSTPRVSSYWNRVVKEHMALGDWDVFTGNFHENKFLSEESVNLIESSITDPVLRKQELEGEIIDSVVENCIISFDLAAFPKPNDKQYVMGVDVARFGNDSTVIVIRNSSRIIHREEIFHGDTFTIVSKIESLNREYGPFKSIYLDGTGGYSSGIEDTLKLSYDNIVSVNFGGKANDEYSFNCRSEMYFNLVKALEEGFYIDQIEYHMILNELFATSYIITPNGKRAIVPKDKIKEIIGHSPDSADALALTFYNELGSNYVKINKARERELINTFFR